MRVGVISDTHIVAGGLGLRKIAAQLVSKSREGLDYLRQIVETHFKGVNRIIHAGDLIDAAVLDMLEEIAPVDAVCGNMDHSDVTRSLPAKKVLTLEGHRIGLIHGWGAPDGLAERVRREFSQVEAIVFGHSHAPMNDTIDGILFFNPGSPIDKRFAKFNSLGILDIDKEGIKGSIIQL